MKKTTFWLLAFFIFFAALAAFGLFLSPASQKDDFDGRQAAAAPSISPSGSAIQNFWGRLSSPIADWVGLDQTPGQQPPVGCPKGFQKCGGWCCNKKTQECKVTA